MGQSSEVEKQNVGSVHVESRETCPAENAWALRFPVVARVTRMRSSQGTVGHFHSMHSSQAHILNGGRTDAIDDWGISRPLRRSQAHFMTPDREV